METAAAAVGLVAAIGSAITIVSKTILSLNTARLKFSEADLTVELLVGQLYTVRTALNQVQAFVRESSISEDDQHEEFATDLCVAVEHCKLLVQHIDDQISRLDWLPGEHLQGRGKTRLLLEERILRDNMMLLNNQISALNLCLTAFKCRPLSPTKEPFERDLLQSPSSHLTDDTASTKLAADLMSFPPPSELQPVSRPASKVGFIKKFDLERLSLKATFYEHGFRSLSRSSSLGTQELQEKSPVTLKHSMLKLTNSMAQSARVDSLIKRDASQRERYVRLLAVGQRPTSAIKRLHYALTSPPQADEIERCRRVLVPSAVRSLLALAEHVGNKIALFDIIKRQTDIQALESFVEHDGPTWEVTRKVSKAAMSLWRSPRVQEYYKQMQQGDQSAYFLRATERILQPIYKPTLTDMIKTNEEHTAAATEVKMTVDDITVDIIDAPSPKLSRLMRHFEDADAYLLTLDLSTYDQYADDSTTNLLSRAISSISSRWKINRQSNPVLLILYNAAIFRRKLPTSPLATHFPSYRGARDFDSAKEHIRACCRKMLKPEQAVFHHYSEDDAEDPATIEFFKESVRELPQLIMCVRNFDEYLGIKMRPADAEAGRRRVSKPSRQLRASF